MTIVAGPFLPEADWQDLVAQVKGMAGLTLGRSVPAMQPSLQAHSLSVSQCGYNTVMDILESRTPALVVPFVRGQEDEQIQRAQKLAELGLVEMLNPTELTGQRLAERILQLRDFSPNPSGLNLAGADHTVRLIQELLAGKNNSLAESQPKECAHAC